MTEQELRALVRQAIAYHLHDRGAAGQPRRDAPVTLYRNHPSQAMFTLPGDPGGACLVEPAAPCTHCGFCRTYGH